MQIPKATRSLEQVCPELTPHIYLACRRREFVIFLRASLALGDKDSHEAVLSLDNPLPVRITLKAFLREATANNAIEL
jgi:hypothetical protein